MSLCRAYSAPAIRTKLALACMAGSEGPAGGKVLEGHSDLFHAFSTCVAACTARLRYDNRSVAARAGTTIQSCAEFGQWRAAACANRWNGDGLLVEHSIGNDHAVGND